MDFPKFHTFFRPFLELLASDGEMHMRDVQRRLQASSGLSLEELAQRIPSGNSTVVENRIGWSRTYLFKAGLIDRVARGRYRISDAGRRMLETHKERISIDDLLTIPVFNLWSTACKDSAKEGTDEESLPPRIDLAPDAMDETMVRCERDLRRLVEEELGQYLKEMTPVRFEYLVEQLVVKLGYGSSDDEVRRALGGGHGDGGVDGVINEDRLGLGQIYLQAKRWDGTVGRPELQKFVGAMHGKAQRGVFITNSEFSRDAEDYARGLQGLKLRLINGAELVSLMVDCGLGVAESRRYIQYRIDSDFFDEGE